MFAPDLPGTLFTCPPNSSNLGATVGTEDTKQGLRERAQTFLDNFSATTAASLCADDELLVSCATAVCIARGGEADESAGATALRALLEVNTRSIALSVTGVHGTSRRMLDRIQPRHAGHRRGAATTTYLTPTRTTTTTSMRVVTATLLTTAVLRRRGRSNLAIAIKPMQSKCARAPARVPLKTGNEGSGARSPTGGYSIAAHVLHSTSCWARSALRRPGTVFQP